MDKHPLNSVSEHGYSSAIFNNFGVPKQAKKNFWTIIAKNIVCINEPYVLRAWAAESLCSLGQGIW